MVVKVNFLKVQWEKEAKSSAPVWAVAFASQTRRIKMLELIPASAIIAIVVIALIVIFLAVGYVKAPPDMAFIMFVV